MNVEIDALMLRRLKQLCHPDRHADNDMSVLVMKWLNTLATPAPVTATRSRQDFFYQSSASVHEHAEALRRRAQHRSAQAQQSASNYNNSYSASTAAAQDEMVRQMQENMRRMQENMMREAAEKDTKL